MRMKTFLQSFYDYVKSPEGFNCVEFEYDGVEYQVSEGHIIWFRDKAGKEHMLQFPKDIEVLLDARVLHDGKSLRDVWGKAKSNELSPEYY
jgi:hypothetical protein